MNSRLLRPFSAEEVKQAVFQMHPSKLPSPDGMSCFFFQKYWHIVGSDVITTVLSVLASGHILRKINYTHIALISKNKNLRRMSDFRPISQCNVIYEVIPKGPANRLKPILFVVISDAQSAFMLGRLITDNIIVAFEVLNSLKSRHSGQQMAVKLDMSKAYDSVKWCFLERIMQKMGFDENWIKLTMECVKTPSFLVLLNGEPHGFVTSYSGTRLGDPLSPYLFLLCAEGFTALLRQAERERRLSGISICRETPNLTPFICR